MWPKKIPCDNSTCIQWPNMVRMEQKIDKLNDKIEEMVKHNYEIWIERDTKMAGYMQNIADQFANLDKTYVKKDTVKLVFFVTTIILWTIFSVIKFVVPLFLK